MVYRSKSQIRVFLSSTFRDMQNERDALVKLFKVLANEGRKRGIDIKLIDLRWGITDNQKRNGKVISTCFQEIDNARPFFIGIVGKRYGWIPSQEEIFANQDLCDRFPFVKDFSREGLSITEMEMRYGIHSTQMYNHSLFLIKANTEYENLRHKQLKEFLTSPAVNHAFYSSIDELTNIVERKMYELIEKTSPNISNLTELERFDFESNKRILDNSNGYIEIGDILSKMDSWFSQNLQYLVVSGESGSGKSSAISYWLKTRDFKGVKRIVYFVDDRDEVDSLSEIQRSILIRLQEEYGLPHTKVEKFDLLGYEYYKNEIANALKIADDSGDKWLIIIDGINKLENKLITKQLSWMPFFPKSVKVLLSTTPEDHTYQILCTTKGYLSIDMAFPDENACMIIIRKYLANLGKTLDYRLVNKIANATLFHNPKILRLVLDELVTYGIHEDIPYHVAKYLSSSNKKELYTHILIHAEEYYGYNLMKDVVSLLSITQDGLTDAAIIEILNIKPIDWSMVYCGLQRLLSCINGKYHFFDLEMLDAVNIHYYGSENPTYLQTQKYTSGIISYLEKKKVDILELTFQYARSENWVKVYQMLMNPIITFRFILNKDKLFIAFWVEIIKNTSYTPHTYLNIVFEDYKEWNAEIQILYLSKAMEVYFSKLDFVNELLEKANGIMLNKMQQPGFDKTLLASCISINYSRMADNYTALSEFDKTREYLDKAENICLSVDAPVDSTIYTAKGNLYTTLGDFRVALKYHQLAYEIEVSDNKSKDYLIDYKYPNNLGLAFFYIGNYELALNYIEKSLEIIRSKYNIFSIEGAGVLNNLGLVYLKLNQPLKAMENFLFAKKGYSLELLEESRHMAIVLSNIGIAQQNLNNLNEAVKALSEAYVIHKRVDPESMDYALCAINLGHVYTLKTQYAEAIPYLTDGVRMFWQKVDLNNSYLGMGAICLIEAYTNTFRYADAESLINALGQKSFEEMGKDNWVIGHCHYKRAKLYKKAGIDSSYIMEDYMKARNIFLQLNELGMVDEIDENIKAL